MASRETTICFARLRFIAGWFGRAYKIPAAAQFQTWGFTDKYSWIGYHSHGARAAALPFDRAYQPKPAYDAMLEEISKQWNRLP